MKKSILLLTSAIILMSSSLQVMATEEISAIEEGIVIEETVATEVRVVASYDIAYPENENSLHNVKTACDYINGYILPENAVFSYNDVVGNRTKERGFVNATSFENGRVTTSLGGGVCGPSSALYNCALAIGADVKEQYNHSLEVGYVPAGLDAAVVWGYKDFKFKNPYNTPLVISATYNDETKLYNITLTANVAEQTVNNVPRVETLGNQKYVVYLDSYENDQLIETVQIGVSSYKGVYTD